MKNAAVATMSAYPAHMNTNTTTTTTTATTTTSNNNRIYREISNVLAAASSHNLHHHHQNKSKQQQQHQMNTTQYYSHLNNSLAGVGNVGGGGKGSGSGASINGPRNTLATKSGKFNTNNVNSHNFVPPYSNVIGATNNSNGGGGGGVGTSCRTMSSMNSTIYPHKSIVMARHGETMNVRDRGSKLLNTFGMSPSMASSKRNQNPGRPTAAGAMPSVNTSSQQQQQPPMNTLSSNPRQKKTPFHHQNHHQHQHNHLTHNQHHHLHSHHHMHNLHNQHHPHAAYSTNTSPARQNNNNNNTSNNSSLSSPNAFVMTALAAAAAQAQAEAAALGGAPTTQAGAAITPTATATALAVITNKQQQQLAERAKLVNEYLKQIFDAATLIIPQFLYLGGHSSVKNAESLHKMGITHVLNMAQELKLDPRKLAEKNIKLMHIAAKDAKTYNIRSDFDMAFKFIDDALVNKGKIVINCARGISRSATIVIAYLMFRYKMSLVDAFSLIVRLRPQVRPNSNFRRQLQLYEQELIQMHNQQQQQQQMQQKYAAAINAAKKF